VSRLPDLPDPSTDPDDEPPPSNGRLRSTSPGVVTGFTLVGLVLGWLLHPVSVAVNGSAPTVGWLPVLALLFVAAVVGAVAWSTHRQLHRRRERLEPHRAVNRLVLAKSCALAGALIAGGYLGYALSWLGYTDAELARQRAVHALVGGVSGALLVVASLLLERACRVSRDDS
jgi:apolipoprotein N-acyltransferase